MARRFSSVPDWVGLGSDFFDGNHSMRQVCELVVQLMGLTNPQFVDAVYANVVGNAPSQQEHDYFMGLLERGGGTTTQAELLVLAANAEVNATKLDLVGLQTTGVGFL